VVPNADREPRENSPFAFGADATLRMKRVAFAPIALGDNGPDRDDGVLVGAKVSCDASAVCGPLPRPRNRCLSDFDFERERDIDAASAVLWVYASGDDA